MAVPFVLFVLTNFIGGWTAQWMCLSQLSVRDGLTCAERGGGEGGGDGSEQHAGGEALPQLRGLRGGAGPCVQQARLAPQTRLPLRGVRGGEGRALAALWVQEAAAGVALQPRHPGVLHLATAGCYKEH